MIGCAHASDLQKPSLAQQTADWVLQEASRQASQWDMDHSRRSAGIAVRDWKARQAAHVPDRSFRIELCPKANLEIMARPGTCEDINFLFYSSVERYGEVKRFHHVPTLAY